MKTFHFLLLLTVLLSGCSFGKRSDRHLNPIVRSQVVGATVLKMDDTTRVRLSDTELDALCRIVNETGGAEMYKSAPHYRVEVLLKDTTRIFKLNGRLFGERDLYIELKDKDWLRRIYEKGISASGGR